MEPSCLIVSEFCKIWHASVCRHQKCIQLRCFSQKKQTNNKENTVKLCKDFLWFLRQGTFLSYQSIHTSVFIQPCSKSQVIYQIKSFEKMGNKVTHIQNSENLIFTDIAENIFIVLFSF